MSSSTIPHRKFSKKIVTIIVIIQALQILKVSGKTVHLQRYKTRENENASREKSSSILNKIKSEGLCGAPSYSRQSRIVGGKDSFEGEFPWMVSFKSTSIGQHFCAGFVISERHVVSAAHCFFSKSSAAPFLSYRPDGVVDASSVTAAVGEFTLISKERLEKEVQIPVEEIIIHPAYTSTESTADIALIRLQRSVDEHSLVTPICLPWKFQPNTLGIEDSKLQCTTAGWGYTNTTHDYTHWEKSMDVLQKAQVELWTAENCRAKYSGTEGLPSEAFLCAGGSVAPHGETCLGDSGGPLMAIESDKWTAIGVVSSGKLCAHEGHPTIYTDLKHFLPWIQQHI